MSLSTLAIQTEAWVQEELGAQRALLEALSRTEQAARAGKSAGLERHGRELEGLLEEVGARDARRRALLGRLAGALGLPANGVTLSRLVARMEADQLDPRRLQGLRAELREIVAGVVRTSRRLAAVAQYHRGLMNELCSALTAGGAGIEGAGALLDAEG